MARIQQTQPIAQPRHAAPSVPTGKRAMRRRLAALLVFGDIAAIILAFSFACRIWLGVFDPGEVGPILAALLPIYLVGALSREAFSADATNDFATGYRRAFFALVVATGSILLIAFFLKVSIDFSRMVMGLGSLGSAATLAASRYLVTQQGRRRLGDTPFATLVIDATGDTPITPGAVDAASLGLSATLDSAGQASRLGDLARGHDRIIVRCNPRDRGAWALALKSLAIHGEIVVPELDALSPLALTRIDGKTGLLLSSNPLSISQRTLKRAFDLAVVLALLPLAIPLALIVAIAIKLDSRGPVLFRQERIGLDNRPFQIWKFRSMRHDASDRRGSRSTARNDDRITRIGRFIRRTSLDELPQLANVIAGDMSIVGPRPHAEGSRAGDALFWDIDARYWHRHAVKPGLTGLAQVRGHRGATHDQGALTDRLQADLEYVTDWSLGSDIRILLRTFAVLWHDNAY